MLEFYEQATRKRVSLGHDDEGRAKCEVDQVAARLRGKEPPTVERDITIQELFDIYDRETPPGSDTFAGLAFTASAGSSRPN